MSEYFKFPSTLHIYLPEEEKHRKDKVMAHDEILKMLKHEITIEEKIDGANLGISFDDTGTVLLQNRGNWLQKPLIGQWKKLDAWIARKQDQLFDVLADQYILFGEWCYATHSIYYDQLPDYFIGFDLYDKKESRFLSVERRDRLLRDMEIAIIPKYSKGKYQLQELFSFFSKSHFGNQLCEGIYIRWDEGKWLKERAKLVRYDFKQGIEEHWEKRELRVNKVEYND